MFPRHTQIYLPLFFLPCCCRHWLFTARTQIAFRRVLCCYQTSTECPHAFTNKHTRTLTQWFLMCVFIFYFSLFLFTFVHLMHFCPVLIWVYISSFYVSSTAEWHQQVSWLGQFGWYNCYYQHPTFRRIPGSCTNLSNLMLKWNRALTPWPCSLAAVSNTESCYCSVCLQYKMCLRLFYIETQHATNLRVTVTFWQWCAWR